MKEVASKITVVTLVEIPYQDILKTRQVLPHTIILYNQKIIDEEIYKRKSVKNKEESDEEGSSSESEKEKEKESLEQAEHMRTGYVLAP